MTSHSNKAAMNTCMIHINYLLCMLSSLRSKVVKMVLSTIIGNNPDDLQGIRKMVAHESENS